MAFDDFMLFLSIAEKSASSKARLSTSAIASSFGISQQSASRKLREFEKAGLIMRNPTHEGTEVSLTSEGKSFLRQIYASAKGIIFSKDFPVISGTACSGLGEGSYYTSLGGYKKQFSSKLGFEPFKGTLNLKIKTPIENLLESRIPVSIEGFSTKERSFGKIKCFPALAENKIRAAIILPERSNHTKEMLEIIAPVNLRKEFSLKDGSKVKLQLI